MGEDVRSLVNSLANERIVVPVVACGVAADTRAAVAAIKAGAMNMPFPRSGIDRSFCKPSRKKPTPSSTPMGA